MCAVVPAHALGVKEFVKPLNYDVQQEDVFSLVVVMSAEGSRAPVLLGLGATSSRSAVASTSELGFEIVDDEAEYLGLEPGQKVSVEQIDESTFRITPG